MEHKSINLVRGTVHYWLTRAEKSNITIVFSHGVTADHTMFEKQVEYFKAKYNVLVWDIPLHGLSRPYKDFSYQNCAEDLLQILDQENIENVVLVGMSMGGYPSQVFAEAYPKRVLGLVALDTTPFGLQYYSKSDIWWLKHTAQIAGWYPEKMLKKSMAKAVSKTPYSLGVMTKMLEPLNKVEIIEQMDIAYRVFIEENHDVTFDYPLLILLGEFDKTGKVKQYCEAWAEDTGNKLIIIKNAAHLSNGDNPQQVNTEIETFMRLI